jgi:hypothetical protein
VYVVLGVVAMVWPSLTPRIGAAAAAILFIVVQSRIAETPNVGYVAEGD